ncbi:MAG: hypothetical protein QW774_01570 [Candidatus Micrarchaeaceae archaeon]
MVVDPNDMLIFKMRNMHFAGPSPSQQAQVRAEPQPEQPAQPNAPKQQVSKPEKPAEQPQQAVYQQPPQIQKPQKQETKAAEAKPKAAKTSLFFSGKPKPAIGKEKSQEAEEESKYITEAVLEKGFGEAETEQELAEVLPGPKKLSKTEKDSIEAAKGLTCVLHPWRPAYAICSYCKRPFCYADLVEYDGKFYCLEDIDKVATGRKPAAVTSYNRFSSAAGGIFLVTAIIFGYFIYPQLSYIASYVSASGLTAFVLNYQKYATPLLNTIIILMLIAAGVNVLVRRGKGSYSSAILGGLIIVAISYEYLNSSISYLLLTSLLGFISIVLLAYGRVAKSATEEEAEVKQTNTIEWPRLETF